MVKGELLKNLQKLISYRNFISVFAWEILVAHSQLMAASLVPFHGVSLAELPLQTCLLASHPLQLGWNNKLPTILK
jgi:hypothetical protein